MGHELDQQAGFGVSRDQGRPPLAAPQAAARVERSSLETVEPAWWQDRHRVSRIGWMFLLEIGGAAPRPWRDRRLLPAGPKARPAVTKTATIMPETILDPLAGSVTRMNVQAS